MVSYKINLELNRDRRLLHCIQLTLSATRTNARRLVTQRADYSAVKLQPIRSRKIAG